MYKIPHDVDIVVGIPRSGMIPAAIISENLNIPLIDIYSFCNGNINGFGGGRYASFGKKIKSGKVLVVDDTVWSGNSKKEAKELLKKYEGQFTFIYLVPYLEGPAEDQIDIFLEDVRPYTHNFSTCVLYEWNLFNHYKVTNSIFDMDGVLCVDPPDERNTKEYEEYIQNATPLVLPTPTIKSIVTYRLDKYRDITVNWLIKNNIKCANLVMFKANSWDERNSFCVPPSMFKAQFYQSSDAELFIESETDQAEQIYAITHKPVYCYKNNTMYGNEYNNVY